MYSIVRTNAASVHFDMTQRTAERTKALAESESACRHALIVIVVHIDNHRPAVLSGEDDCGRAGANMHEGSCHRRSLQGVNDLVQSHSARCQRFGPRSSPAHARCGRRSKTGKFAHKETVAIDAGKHKVTPKWALSRGGTVPLRVAKNEVTVMPFFKFGTAPVLLFIASLCASSRYQQRTIGSQAVPLLSELAAKIDFC
jgi:hypothetical protein